MVRPVGEFRVRVMVFTSLTGVWNLWSPGLSLRVIFLVFFSPEEVVVSRVISRARAWALYSLGVLPAPFVMIVFTRRKGARKV
ncbi:hypothetical protein IQ63_02030 [Streptomyces acidiscabies]|uniref:Uncharacterized protein n=1 Tax=Streptomyces acidiscabies TaxID=42234 RepID=A0A0L0KN14_9ACTN|nr:hypothetical protein IQ63_02030 [Streptomyces acidiscabies]